MPFSAQNKVKIPNVVFFKDLGPWIWSVPYYFTFTYSAYIVERSLCVRHYFRCWRQSKLKPLPTWNLRYKIEIHIALKLQLYIVYKIVLGFNGEKKSRDRVRKCVLGQDWGPKF